MVGRNSFATDSSFTITNPNFKVNRELNSQVASPMGIKSPVNNRIDIESGDTIPSGNTLSTFQSLQQAGNAPSKDDNVRYLEVAFSPQNQINNDIIGQIGYFNLGDYLGDLQSMSTDTNGYTSFDSLRDAYFTKYTKSYDLVDFVRLIKFFDNSLFKMIKDFTPSNTSLTSGIVVKQHLLERNKHRRTLVSSEDLVLTSSISVGELSAGPGGSVNRYQENIPKFNLTQSWDEIVKTLEGTTTIKHSDESEFYDGIYPNPSQTDISYIDAIDGYGGHDCSRYSNPTFEDSQVVPVFLTDINFSEEEFLRASTSPNKGIVWLWHDGSNVRHIKVSNSTRSGLDISRELAAANEVSILLNNPSSNPLPPNLPKENTGFYVWETIGKRVFDDYTYYEPNISESPTIVASEDANIFDIEFTSTGDFRWLATASGTPANPFRLSGIYESIPQGYFPLTPTFPKEQFFRGWNGADYLIEPNEYYGGTGIIDDILSNFDTGTGEINTAVTSSDVSVYGKYTESPTTPWFMNAPQQVVQYPSALIDDLDPNDRNRTILITAVILTPAISGCPTLNKNAVGVTIALRYEGNESLFGTNPFGSLVLAEGTNGFTTVKDIELQDASSANTVWTVSSITTPSTTTTTLPDGIYGVNVSSAENSDSIIIRIGNVNGKQGIKSIAYCP